MQLPEEQYPFPTEAIGLVVDLFHRNIITKEQTQILNDTIVHYMNLRVEHLGHE